MNVTTTKLCEPTTDEHLIAYHKKLALLCQKQLMLHESQNVSLVESTSELIGAMHNLSNARHAHVRYTSLMII